MQRRPLGRWMPLLAAAWLSCAVAAEVAPKHPTGTAASKSPYVHHVILQDAQDEPKPVAITGQLVLPFSTKSTCGHCHDYKEVGAGWHFNAWDPNAPAGRPGEPWFWVNRKAGVQLPLSPRDWDGAFKPGDIGLTPWLFIQRFGRHYPGGGVGERFAADDQDSKARWGVTGGLEINCLGCHNSDPAQDMEQWGLQIADQNLMWATTATSGLATVKGSCRKAPMSYDRFAPPDEDTKNVPAVKYDAARFDPASKVLMQLYREAPAERCYFCHSVSEVGLGAPQSWQTDDDVHIAAGMKCTSCHRNGLDHKIVRGYEGEIGGLAFSCQGCHYGGHTSTPKGAQALPGRMGAPLPKHQGLPNFHFLKLSCTACHAGPVPGPQAAYVQTSRAHMIEFKGTHRVDDALPHIIAPVFMPQANGKIAPHRMAWPAFWARLKDGAVQPLSPDKVAAAAKEILDEPAQGGAKGLTAEKVTKVLQLLAQEKDAGQPVYVTGGKLHSLGGGALSAADNDFAKPCAWPLGHNVRPASQALGARGCTDCHSKESVFFHGQVPVESFVGEERPTVEMAALMGASPLRLQAWELSFVFRPLFVLFCVASSVFVSGVLVYYLGRGVAGVSRLWC